MDTDNRGGEGRGWGVGTGWEKAIEAKGDICTFNNKELIKFLKRQKEVTESSQNYKKA